MKSVPIGKLLLHETLVAVEERDPAMQPELVLLRVGATALDVDLAGVRRLKALFGEAERRLLWRQEQTLKAKNLTFEF